MFVSSASFEQEGFRELLEYRDAHGNIDVPDDDPEYSQIRTWITAQRGAYR